MFLEILIGVPSQCIGLHRELGKILGGRRKTAIDDRPESSYIHFVQDGLNMEAIDEFIETWGAMGVLWGINRSMARVHALILVSDEPLCLDDIATRLQISRGNTSMSLRELRNWGVIRRANVAGDRKDFFVAEPDTWTVFFRIASERKKREFDPALRALRHVLNSREPACGETVRARLGEMEKLLSTVNRIVANALSDEGKAKSLFRFIVDLAKGEVDRS